MRNSGVRAMSHTSSSRWIGRRTLTAIMLTGAFLIASFASPSTAGAIAAPIKISGTGGTGVNIRSTPDTSKPSLGKIPEGASPRFLCFTHGQWIGGVNVWFRVKYSGITGYYASYYDNSTYSSDANLIGKYGIPKCTSASPAYNRTAAVNWALAHAKDDYPYPAACTWFVSNALWSGTLQRTYEWTSAGGFWDRGWYRSGTTTAQNVTLLKNYLRRVYPTSTYTNITANFATNAVPAAALGDLILYDWTGDGVLDHASMVTHLSPGSYPDVSEWGVYDHTVSDLSPNTPYQYRGWTWSAKYNTWLQKRYPGVKAYLLHISAY